MAKAPVAGEVKTRMTPPLSGDQAAALARALLLDTWRAASAVDGARCYLARAGAREAFPAPLAGADGFEQPGDPDLGARIEGVAAAALARAPLAVIVGGDLPGLPAAHLRRAREALAGADAALGPSADGGFYLIALRRCEPGLLAGLPWSAPETFAACAARLRERGYRVAVVEPFDDVDDIADLRRLRRALAGGEIDAPATAALLAGEPWSSL